MRYFLSLVGGDYQIRPDFKLSEFDSPGSDRVIIRNSILDVVQRLRDAAGASVIVNSGYRTWEYHVGIYRRIAERRGERFDLDDVPSRSAHLTGHAVDVDVVGERPEAVAQWAERQPEVTGVGRYNSFTHIDTKPGGDRRWDRRSEPHSWVSDESRLLVAGASTAGRASAGDGAGRVLFRGLRRLLPVGLVTAGGVFALRELLPRRFR